MHSHRHGALPIRPLAQERHTPRPIVSNQGANVAHLPGLGTDMVPRLLWDSHATDKAAAPHIVELSPSLRVPSSSYMYSVESMFAYHV